MNVPALRLTCLQISLVQIPVCSSLYSWYIENALWMLCKLNRTALKTRNSVAGMYMFLYRSEFSWWIFLSSGAATRPSLGNCHILVPLPELHNCELSKPLLFLNIQNPVFCFCKRKLTDTNTHQVQGSNVFLCQSHLVVEGGLTLGVHHFLQHCDKMHAKAASGRKSLH